MLTTALVAALLLCPAAPLPVQDQSASPSQSPAQAQPVHVPASEMLGLVENKLMPQYPVPAMKNGIEGSAIFHIEVDQTGKIVSIQPVTGHPALLAAGKDALSQYHFRPYLVDGTPVKVDSQIGFQFTLSRKGNSTQGQVECITTLP